eukprot:Skav212934  [mRNA]  locus=scaffold374:408683:411854:- [translate_table: standard]
MAPIPPYVARVTETQRGVELHTTPANELLTVSSRTKKAPKWSIPGKRTGDPLSGTAVGHYSFDDPHRDINGRYKRDPRWSMTPYKEGRVGSLPPGPGRYNNRDGVLRESAPSWSFGSTSKGAGGLRMQIQAFRRDDDSSEEPARRRINAEDAAKVIQYEDVGKCEVIQGGTRSREAIGWDIGNLQ